VDRTRARDTIATGLRYGMVALFVFGLAFYVAVLYLA
jgi:hypothetical protein